MAVYWITDALPISATAVLPIVIFPMMGVSKVSDLASKYITVRPLIIVTTKQISKNPKYSLLSLNCFLTTKDI